MFVLSQINFPLKYRHQSWSQLSCTACAIKAHKRNNILHCLFESNQEYHEHWHAFNFMVLRKNYRVWSSKPFPLCVLIKLPIVIYIGGNFFFFPLTARNTSGLFSCLPLLTPVEGMWTWSFLWKQRGHHTLTSCEVRRRPRLEMAF